MLYYIFLGVAFVCFAFHTIVHLLEHSGRISHNRRIFAAIGIAMFFGWFSYFFISFNDPYSVGLTAFTIVGILLLIPGFCLWGVSHAKMHKRMHKGKGKLVTTGLYGHIRHPMYLGNLMMFLGAPMLGGALLTLAISPVFMVMVLIWRHIEEKELLKEFPKEYSEYKKKTWF